MIPVNFKKINNVGTKCKIKKYSDLRDNMSAFLFTVPPLYMNTGLIQGPPYTEQGVSSPLPNNPCETPYKYSINGAQQNLQFMTFSAGTSICVQGSSTCSPDLQPVVV